MKRRSERAGNDTRYFLQFTGSAVLLLAATLVLVLFVLPQRFVLSSGFQEGSLNFPTPSTPFEPLESRLVTALPMPVVDGTVGRGPAESFWDEVLPLLRAERWADAIPLFAFYLGDYPGDEDVRREYAITLARAGQGDLAVPLFERILRSGDDRQLRLMLARTLRDVGRTREAAAQYGRLATGATFDETIALEWIQSLAWVEEYDDAIAAAHEMLLRSPDSVPLRVELVRLYYYTDRLEDAALILEGLSDAEVEGADATALRDDIVAALTPPPGDPEIVTEPSTLDRALRAREEGRIDEAGRLYREAVAETPESAGTWRAFADFLQYERSDLAEALVALREVERLEQGGDSALQARMAQLELWLGQDEEARARFEGLLGLLEREATGAAPEPRDSPHALSRADVLVILGDLDRWSGRPSEAAARYDEALVAEATHPGAVEGRRALDAEVATFVAEVEQPGTAALAHTFTDNERFDRLDVGGEWTGTREKWAWSTRSGGRFLRGFDATRAEATARGAFADLEGARWLRWGTVRLGVAVGVQSVRSSDVDLTVGASARFLGRSGRSTRLAYEKGPAFVETNTLQAEFADVGRDQISVEHSQPLGEVWSVAATADGMLLNHGALPGSDRNVRVAGALALQRPVSDSWSVGLASRAVAFTAPAPDPAALPLYWDPTASLSLGPVLQYSLETGDTWSFVARANPGIAYLDERRSGGAEIIPDIAANVGAVRDGDRFRTAVDLYYGQGRAGGYRSFGIDISISAVKALSGGGP